MSLRQYLDKLAVSAACEPLSVPPADRCSYVINHHDVCSASDGLLEFQYLEYCVLGNQDVYIFIAAGLWILVLLTLLAKAASDFFCPALELISETLKLPPAVAGATLLALGNGAPDVFIQLAATSTGGDVDRAGVVIALTEPVGGGLFVSNVVLGAILLFGARSRTVKLEGRVFMKDATFYLAALLIVFWVIMTKHAYQFHGLLLLFLYAVYVVVTLVLRERAEVVDSHDKHHTHIVHYLPALVPQYIPESPSCSSSDGSYSDDDEGPLQPLLQNIHDGHDVEHARLHATNASEDSPHTPHLSTVITVAQNSNGSWGLDNKFQLMDVSVDSVSAPPKGTIMNSDQHLNEATVNSCRCEVLRSTYAMSDPVNTLFSPCSGSEPCSAATEPLLEPLLPPSSPSLSPSPSHDQVSIGHTSSPSAPQRGAAVLGVSSFIARSQQLHTADKAAECSTNTAQQGSILIPQTEDTPHAAEENNHSIALPAFTQTQERATELSEQDVDGPQHSHDAAKQLGEEDVTSGSTTKLEQSVAQYTQHKLAMNAYTSHVPVPAVSDLHSLEQFTQNKQQNGFSRLNGALVLHEGCKSHTHAPKDQSHEQQQQDPGCHLCNGSPCRNPNSSPRHHHHHHHHHHHRRSRFMTCIACLWEYICLPLDLLLGCTMPFVATGGDPPYTRWQATCLPFTIPLLLAFTLNPDVFQSGSYWMWGAYAVVATAAAVAVFVRWPVRTGPQGALNMVLAGMSFLLASVWMEQGADELIAVCTYMGSKLGISPSVMGATVLAWGNALPDLVCNVTMAREGFPTMALAAVFASPLFILAIGAGMGLASGVWSDPANMEAVHCPVRMVYMSAIITTIMHIILGAAIFKFNLGRNHAIIAFSMYAAYQAAYVAIIVPNSPMHAWCS